MNKNHKHEWHISAHQVFAFCKLCPQKISKKDIEFVLNYLQGIQDYNLSSRKLILTKEEMIPPHVHLWEEGATCLFCTYPGCRHTASNDDILLLDKSKFYKLIDTLQGARKKSLPFEADHVEKAQAIKRLQATIKAALDRIEDVLPGSTV